MLACICFRFMYSLFMCLVIDFYVCVSYLVYRKFSDIIAAVLYRITERKAAQHTL